jgi:xanthine dehydrogenase accessory factor
MLVYPDGRIFGTIGGGRVEKKVIENALTVLNKKKPVLIHYDLLKDLGMSCGGSLDMYIEPVMRKNKLYIFGAGHTGLALAKRAGDFDFDITVIDDRKDYIDQLQVTGMKKVFGDFNQILQGLFFDDTTYICIMTYGHSVDREILSYCIKKPHAYLGMMGSRRKVEMTKKIFLEEGLSTREELEKVDMPMGIEIGADGPDEISISIIARLLAVKNKIKI